MGGDYALHPLQRFAVLRLYAHRERVAVGLHGGYGIRGADDDLVLAQLDIELVALMLAELLKVSDALAVRHLSGLASYLWPFVRPLPTRTLILKIFPFEPPPAR